MTGRCTSMPTIGSIPTLLAGCIRTRSSRNSAWSLDAEGRWEELRPQLSRKIGRVRRIEAQLARGRIARSRREPLHEELMALYSWTFNAFKIKGVIEAKEAPDGACPARKFQAPHEGGARGRRVALAECALRC